MYNCQEKLEELREEVGVSVEVKSFTPQTLKPFKRQLLEPSFGQLLNPEKDGFLQEVGAKTPLNFVLIVEAPRDRHIRPVIVSGRSKRIIRLGDQTPQEPLATYAKVVVTNPTKEDWESTKYNRENNLRLVSVTSDLFAMWEIGVVTRIIGSVAKHFLTVQKEYEGKMYNLGGTVLIPDFPGFDQWGDLQNILEEWPDPTLAHLTEIESLVQTATTGISAAPLEENRARVIFFNLAGGKGKAATTAGQEALTVHWSKIETSERFAHLEKGQIISFTGTAPENEKSNNIQAIGIRIVA